MSLLPYIHYSLIEVYYKKEVTYTDLLHLLLDLSYIKRFTLLYHVSVTYDVDDNIIQILKLLLDNNKVPKDSECGYGKWSNELSTDEWWNLEQQVNTAPNHHKAVLYDIVNFIRPPHGYTRKCLNSERQTYVGF